MVVKPPAKRVAELLESDRGLPVAPAGKFFEEWVGVNAAELGAVSGGSAGARGPLRPAWVCPRRDAGVGRDI